MNKFRIIIHLLVFLNYLLLPSIAIVFEFKIPQTQVSICEEEQHKTHKLALIDDDLENFTEYKYVIIAHLDAKSLNTVQTDEKYYLSAFYTLISPPPELLA